MGKVSSQLIGGLSVRVKELNVRVGNCVKKGDIVDKLSTEQLEAARLAAEGAFTETETLVTVAESRITGAKLVLGRQERLHNSTSFQRSAFEHAGGAEASLRSARGVTARRQTEVERIALTIRRANIVAPYDGVG